MSKTLFNYLNIAALFVIDSTDFRFNAYLD